jgi:hypothetical protein
MYDSIDCFYVDRAGITRVRLCAMYCDIAKTWVNASVSPPRPNPMCFVFKTKVMFSSGSKYNRESTFRPR